MLLPVSNRSAEIELKPLPRIQEEHNLVLIIDEGKEFLLHPDAAEAWKQLKESAEKEGIHLALVSAFRSIKRQSEIIENKRRKGIPESEIFKTNVPAGFSEHHSGRAIDVSTEGYAPLEEEFEQSPAFRWLQKHSEEFGFSLSYPRDNSYGIANEPWHWFYKA